MQCIDLLEQLNEATLAAQLHTALQGSPLQPPADHKGPEATDMFLLDLSLAQRRQTYDALNLAVAKKLSTPATRARGLAGFLAAWQEYVHYEEPRCAKS